MNYKQQHPKTSVELQLMQGFPPPPSKVVNQENWLLPPYNRWAFQNLNSVLTTSTISRGADAAQVWQFPRREMDISAVTFTGSDGQSHNFVDMLGASYTDAIVVLHRGEIVCEQYFNGQRPDSRHVLFSASKSIAGTLVTTLAHDGFFDLQAPIEAIVPALKNSGYAGCSVQQLLNMLAGIKHDHDETNPSSEFLEYMVAANYLPPFDGYQGATQSYDFLTTLSQDRPHGETFDYITANTEVLAWLVSLTTGKSIGDHLSERVWQKLGMEHDAYVLSGRDGTESWGGGFCASARDTARFGQLMLQGGHANGEQLIPEAVINGFITGADPEKLAASDLGGDNTGVDGWSYRDQWWTTHHNRAFAAYGMHSQWIFVDPKSEMVLVKQSSYPKPLDELIDYDVPIAIQALAEYLQSLS